MDAAHRLINNWHGNKFAGLYLYGTPGTGKTHFAVALGRALIERDEETAIAYSHLPVAKLYCNPGDFMEISPNTEYNYYPKRIFSPMLIKKEPTRVVRPRPMGIILDDYRPEHQKHAIGAIEAAAEYGGLVLITSNHPDPMRILEKQPVEASNEQMLQEDHLRNRVPELLEKREKLREAQQAEISASLRSRLAAGFKFIEFEGPDRRIGNSFWN